MEKRVFTENCFMFKCIIPVVFLSIRKGWGTSKHNCLVSYLLCWRRYVSATVGHPQVTKIYKRGNLYSVWSLAEVHISKLSSRSSCRLIYPFELIVFPISRLITLNIMDIYINKLHFSVTWRAAVHIYSGKTQQNSTRADRFSTRWAKDTCSERIFHYHKIQPLRKRQSSRHRRTNAPFNVRDIPCIQLSTY